MAPWAPAGCIAGGCPERPPKTKRPDLFQGLAAFFAPGASVRLHRLAMRRCIKTVILLSKDELLAQAAPALEVVLTKNCFFLQGQAVGPVQLQAAHRPARLPASPPAQNRSSAAAQNKSAGCLGFVRKLK